MERIKQAGANSIIFKKIYYPMFADIYYHVDIGFFIMRLTRRQLRKLINEIAGETSNAHPGGNMTIENYLESVDYDVDPSLIDLLFTLKPLGFVVSSSNPERDQLELTRPAFEHVATGETVFDDLSIYGQTSDLLLHYPHARHFRFKSLGQAAMEIPEILSRHQK